MEEINLTSEQIEHVMNCFCRSFTCHQKDDTKYNDCPCKCYYAKSLFAELVDKEKLAKVVMDDAQKLIDYAVNGGFNNKDNYREYNHLDCMNPTIEERKYYHTLTETEIKEISDRISEKVREEIERQFEEIKRKK